MTKPLKQECDVITAAAPDFQNRWQTGSMLTRLGIALIILSGILWFSLFSIPFLPISTAQKGTVGIVTFVGVQITWWSGAAFVGPKAMKNFGGWFRGLRSRLPK